VNPNAAPTTRVSRHELALNTYVWITTGITFAGIGIATVIIALLPLGLHRVPMLAFAGALGLNAAWILISQPAAIGSLRNHVHLAAIYVGVGVGMLAYAPDGVAALGASMFIGPLAVTRLVDRREITAHLIAATGCLLGPAIYAGTHFAGMLGLISLLLAMWTVAGCIALVLEAAEAQGAELEDLVRRDPLTGLGNRRVLTEHVASEMRRHARARRPLTIVVLDLADFRTINDRYGRSSGDDLLQSVATALVDTLPSTALVTRPGGDRFTIVLSDTSPEDAPRAVNAVRAALSACSDGLSCNVGVASFPRDAVHDKVLMHVAGERLEAAKAAAAVAGDTPPPPAAIPRTGFATLPVDDRLSA
jgi:diguanylate cyclase (GGDEF)-like protein